MRRFMLPSARARTACAERARARRRRPTRPWPEKDRLAQPGDVLAHRLHVVLGELGRDRTHDRMRARAVGIGLQPAQAQLGMLSSEPRILRRDAGTAGPMAA